MDEDKRDEPPVPVVIRETAVRRTDTEVVMESLSQAVQQMASALVEAERMKLRTVEIETAAEIRRAELDSAASIELAQVEKADVEASREHDSKREITIRIVAPIGLIGVIAVILYAINAKMLAESATALIALSGVVTWMRQLFARPPRVRRLPESKKQSKDVDDQP